MVVDLRSGLLGTAEAESPHPDDFERQLRARTLRLLAPLLGIDIDPRVARSVTESDEAILATLPKTARAWYDEARSEARRQLVAEQGGQAA